MGLDMYVYRVQKPCLDVSKVYDRDDIYGVVIDENEINAPMYCQLIPYCERLRVITHYYNFDKLKEDYGLSEVHIGGYSYDGNGAATFIYGVKDGEKFNAKIKDDVIMNKYIIDKEESCYVCKITEVQYWRKAYDIQDWFHENIPCNVENTGYYLLDEDQRAEFNKEFPYDTLPEDSSEEYAYFYWEWY